MSWGRIVLIVVLATTVARADDKPWVAGVPEENKVAAKALLDAGNRLFVEHDYVRALEQYQLAIAKWDHPAIRFNMVRCLIQLDRVIEANENLALALRFGAAPLEEAVYNEALAYQKLLANEVGTIRIRCKQRGASVSLDGAQVVTCPGSQDKRVKPGRHQLVGTKTGYLTKTAEVFVVGGATETVDVELATLASTAKIVQRWSSWVPWVVVGAGLTATGVGGLVLYQSFQDMKAYDRALVTACFDIGCGTDQPLPASVADQKSRAILENRIAIGTMSAGIATVITGGVLLYLNRARAVYEVSPQPGGVTISATGRF